MHIVELEEIYKNYGDLQVLKDINIQIKKREPVLLLLDQPDLEKPLCSD